MTETDSADQEPVTDPLSQGDYQWVQASARDLYELPDPGDELRLEEFPEELQKMWRQLRQHNVILLAGKTQVRGGDWRNLWTVNQAAAEIVEKHREVAKESDTILPCDCTTDAIRNPRDVDGIECKICEEVFDREEIDRGGRA
ncbi:SGNH/GDSL hydrolase family protein [Natrinema salsiterrestre]|uniref:Uncharacterized protein n=1 Tax=Natrinema salsiterrestre TaxID=2950540 RepID=A0A9Q4Q2K0_9EURY|nr:SGNH/GDSL hydrolase family protein [Natrinema salsiterrestre]MDF9748394.1 hypothetical protein [Natrinema salsiterrestre]